MSTLLKFLSLTFAVPSAVPGAMNPLALSNSLVAWLTVALLWLSAAYFLLRMRRISSSKAKGGAPCGRRHVAPGFNPGCGGRRSIPS